MIVFEEIGIVLDKNTGPVIVHSAMMVTPARYSKTTRYDIDSIPLGIND